VKIESPAREISRHITLTHVASTTCACESQMSLARQAVLDSLADSAQVLGKQEMLTINFLD